MSAIGMEVDTAQGLSLRPESPMKTSEDAESKPLARPGTIGSRDAVVQIFEAFHVELDAHHDRRERLIKMSRDITNLSKKAIFLLHRLAAQSTSSSNSSASTLSSDTTTTPPTPTTSTTNATNAKTFSQIASLGFARLAEIEALFRRMRPELAGGVFWRYQSQVSPGLQEYIEALAFAHYLDTGALIGYEEVQARLRDEEGEYFPLPLEEYLLGVSDLTGELMRFAITAIARRGGRQKAGEVSDFVRHCKADFDGFTPYVKNLGKKQAVTAQSLMKIEDAAYAIAVRASEYAGSEDILEDIVERCVLDVRSKRYDAYEGGSGHGDIEYRDGEGYSDMFV